MQNYLFNISFNTVHFAHVENTKNFELALRIVIILNMYLENFKNRLIGNQARSL